jgi:hypothetical protein
MGNRSFVLDAGKKRQQDWLGVIAQYLRPPPWSVLPITTEELVRFLNNHALEGEPLMRRALVIFWTSLGAEHPNTNVARASYDFLLQKLGKTRTEIKQRLDEMQRAIR